MAVRERAWKKASRDRSSVDGACPRVPRIAEARNIRTKSPARLLKNRRFIKMTSQKYSVGDFALNAGPPRHLFAIARTKKRSHDLLTAKRLWASTRHPF